MRRGSKLLRPIGNAVFRAAEGAPASAELSNGVQTVDEVVNTLKSLAKSSFGQQRGQAQAAMAVKPKQKTLPQTTVDAYGAVSVVCDPDEKHEAGVYKNVGECCAILFIKQQRKNEEMHPRSLSLVHSFFVRFHQLSN